MASSSSELRCAVITPERQVLDAAASSVVFPAHDGLMGVLPGRAALLCELGTGILTVQTTEGQTKRFFVDGGFGQVLKNDIVILTEHAAADDQITIASAQQALQAALQMPPSGTLEAVEARTKAVERAKIQLALAKK